MQGNLSIERMCQLAGVSRAGFYRSLQERQAIEEDMEVRSTIQLVLGGHLKTGHTWSLQKRPTKRTQNKSIYTLPEPVQANFFWQAAPREFILTSPGRRIRRRRDATGAPTQRPEWRGGVSRPY